MSNKILIVFPVDNTTSFLEAIIMHLYKVVHSSNIIVFKEESNLDLRNKLMKGFNEIDFNTILYLGHGNSDNLGSVSNEHNPNSFLLTKEDLQIFSNKNFISLSCNSNELIKKIKHHEDRESIGFGDLPTGWPDITSVRQYEQNAYSGITDEIINQFKDCIVSIMKYSLADYLNKGETIPQFYNSLVLRINKKISDFYKADYRRNMILNEILYSMKHEMRYHIA
jgi:hypothetical protein